MSVGVRDERMKRRSLKEGEEEGACGADEERAADMVREKQEWKNPAGGAPYPGRRRATDYISSSPDLPYMLTQNIH